MSEEAVALNQAAVLPPVEHVAQGGLAELAGDTWRTRRQAAQQDPEDVGASGVLLAEPAQGGDVAVGDAGVGVPPRTPGRQATASWLAARGRVDSWRRAGS